MTVSKQFGCLPEARTSVETCNSGPILNYLQRIVEKTCQTYERCMNIMRLMNLQKCALRDQKCFKIPVITNLQRAKLRK